LGVLPFVVCAAGASGSAPSNTSPPSISGTPEVGETLTANAGTWTGAPAPSFTYQWQRCAATGIPTPPGVNWTSRTPAAANDWLGVTWGGPAGDQKFVAVAISGSGNRVMTSPDAVTWTARTSASDNNWLAVTWGGPGGQEKFVAVAGNGGAAGSGNRVMTSPDGVNWTLRASPVDNSWWEVTWGGPAGQEKFVAVSSTGTGNRVMTSPDGITWSTQASASDSEWRSVVWGGPAGQEKFVAVATTGQVMTSPDGVTWTSQVAAAGNAWWEVTWGGPPGQEKFVAVSSTGTGDRVMTSPDGISWSTQASASDKSWLSVAWGDPPGAIPGQFVAVSSDRPGNLVMTSPDGITWTSRTPASENIWRSVVWGGLPGQEKFVAVSQLGNGPRVMTSQADVTLSCTNIAGEINSTYTLAPADYEAYITVEVTAANGISPDGVASSAASAEVTGRAPANTAAPTLSGTAQVGQTLTALTGTWTGYPTPTHALQWSLCDVGGGNCQNIAGATAPTYTLASTDQGGTIRAQVTATNPVGSSTATSAPTAMVEPAPMPMPPPLITGLTPAPSNVFSVRSSRVSAGVITTVLRVPGAGRTAQVGRARGAKGAACSSSRTSRAAGRVVLTCRITARALPRKCGGSVRVSVRTTFTPTGGAARSKEHVVSVRKRCPTPRVTG
jgi:hypothetical protein